MGETPVAVFLCDAPNRAGRSPAAISPLSLRPHLTRKMAFEQRAIFPQLTGVSSRFSPANGARWWSPAAGRAGLTERNTTQIDGGVSPDSLRLCIRRIL